MSVHVDRHKSELTAFWGEKTDIGIPELVIMQNYKQLVRKKIISKCLAVPDILINFASRKIKAVFFYFKTVRIRHRKNPL